MDASIMMEQGSNTDSGSERRRYDVGGVLLDRPFRIRRLGHFGLVCDDIAASFAFYRDVLGFTVSEEQDITSLLPPAIRPDETGPRDCVVHMLRHSGEHHTLVLFGTALDRAMQKMLYDREPRCGITANQITWQVGSLAEVVNATRFLSDEGVRILAAGRDMPGSNWHVYVEDPDGFSNELYYGMELVGWQGHSKPLPMYHRGFQEPPPLPQPAERLEVDQAIGDGVDLLSGYRPPPPLPAMYNVEGILLPRPFKVARIGPVGLFVDDVAQSERFYQDQLGFELSGRERTADGHALTFLRANTEHHSVALVPLALREALGWSSRSKIAWFGIQLSSYRQLRDAVDWMQARGLTVRTRFDRALHPGIEHAAMVLDPDGHALLLYWSMDQVGSDGLLPLGRPVRLADDGSWPETLDDTPEAYRGEALIGAWI